jgi:hypothetical protein
MIVESRAEATEMDEFAYRSLRCATRIRRFGHLLLRIAYDTLRFGDASPSYRRLFARKIANGTLFRKGLSRAITLDSRARACLRYRRSFRAPDETPIILNCAVAERFPAGRGFATTVHFWTDWSRGRDDFDVYEAARGDGRQSYNEWGAVTGGNCDRRGVLFVRADGGAACLAFLPHLHTRPLRH